MLIAELEGWRSSSLTISMKESRYQHEPPAERQTQVSKGALPLPPYLFLDYLSQLSPRAFCILLP